MAKDGQIHGHLGGLLKVFSGSISTDSNMAETINGFPMADTDFYSLSAYLKNMLKQGDSSLNTVEARQINKTNNPVYVLDIYTAGKSIKPLLLKRVYVDPQTYLPVYWEDYINGKIWSASSWRNIHTNLRLPDNFFQP